MGKLGDFFRRAFGGKPTPPPPPRDLRDDREGWQVGDIARCWRDNWHNKKVGDPKKGDTFRVSKIFSAIGTDNNLHLFLCFVGKERPGWNAMGFVKERPAEESFTEQMRRLHREGSPA